MMILSMSVLSLFPIYTPKPFTAMASVKFEIQMYGITSVKPKILQLTVPL